MAFIYCITNNINGKQYIGKTNHEITRRWHEHIRAARKSTMQHRPLYAAIQKYGVQNFTITQLEKCANEQAIEREQYWIHQLNTYHNGYNATRGGDGKGYIDRDLVIKIYQQENSQKRTAEVLNISTDSVHDILQQANVKPLTSPEVNQKERGCSVDMCSMQGEIIDTFPSARAAAQAIMPHKLNVYGEVSHILDACQGKRKTAYGYIWKFNMGR